MSGLSDMINGESKPEDGEVYSAEAPPGQPAATQDMDGFRSGLIKQTRYDRPNKHLFIFSDKDVTTTNGDTGRPRIFHQT